MATNCIPFFHSIGYLTINNQFKYHAKFSLSAATQVLTLYFVLLHSLTFSHCQFIGWVGGWILFFRLIRNFSQILSCWFAAGFHVRRN